MKLKKNYDIRFLQGVIEVLTIETVEWIPLILFTFSGIFD